MSASVRQLARPVWSLPTSSLLLPCPALTWISVTGLDREAFALDRPIPPLPALPAATAPACPGSSFLHARLLVYCAKILPFTPPKPLGPIPEELKGSTVLIVDDERAWRVILETDLQMLGYRVSVAEDAVEALERAERDSPAVAIIDLMLPEPMDGRALCAELRARGIRVPVVFYTAYP